MTIRRKLLLFIPLLVLLVNLVTFFIFDSGKIVQQSYDLLMDRILLYKEASQTAGDSLGTLYNYLLNPTGSQEARIKQDEAKLMELRSRLLGIKDGSPHASALSGFIHLLDTLLRQEQTALTAAKAGAQAFGDALSHYMEAEKTTGFIREEGQRLVDLELGFYQPVYRQIQMENARMDRLGLAAFIINTLMSVVLAVWISRSITRPVSRLVEMARGISGGNLHMESPPQQQQSTPDEIGVLSEAFKQMLKDLKVLMEKEKESIEKDRLVKELELQALQSQINPHFLFNTLNVLSKLALIEGAGKTSDLIVSMSNLLRYNLRKLEQPVTLQDELEHVKEYFTIQQARFRDRVRFETDIDAAALQEPIPALTIQPIVENAFVHGIEGMENGAVIRLELARVPEGSRLAVSDNGRGMNEEVRQALLRLEAGNGIGEGAGTGKKHSTGLGTKNVFKRLQLFYGRSDLVDIQSEPGKGTTVTILIPHRKEDEQTHVPIVNRG
ncbi:MAG: rane protein [Paenibacillus sp.]|jgi:sensor histidine kinase YesM|nr:rane protein [Paenibacillus sp.]